MATLLDAQVGFKKQTAFGTPIVVDRFIEALADTKHSFDPMVIQGMGLRVSSRYARSARRLAGTGRGEVSLKMELTSKGLGTLLELIAGTSESTLVSGTTFQQRHRPVLATPFMPVATIQLGIPRTDASGTVDAYTYSDCAVKSFSIDVPDNENPPTLEAVFWAASVATATALASASYVTTPTLFSPTTGVTTLGGTLTAPTATALATGGTAATNIRGWTLDVDLGLVERPRVGGWQRPPVGAPKAVLKVKQDYDATTARDAMLAQALTSFSGSFTGGALSAGTERIELDIPTMAIDQDAFPDLTNGDGSIPEITYSVLDNLTDDEWYIVTRTADNAL
jgi:hypothetical protein